MSYQIGSVVVDEEANTIVLEPGVYSIMAPITFSLHKDTQIKDIHVHALPNLNANTTADGGIPSKRDPT